MAGYLPCTDAVSGDMFSLFQYERECVDGRRPESSDMYVEGGREKEDRAKNG